MLAEKNAAYSIDSTSMPFYQHVMLRYPDQASFVKDLEPYHDAAVWYKHILNVHGNAKKREDSKRKGDAFLQKAMAKERRQPHIVDNLMWKYVVLCRQELILLDMVYHQDETSVKVTCVGKLVRELRTKTWLDPEDTVSDALKRLFSSNSMPPANPQTVQKWYIDFRLGTLL